MTRLIAAALLLASAAIGAWIWSALARPPAFTDASLAGSARPLPPARTAAIRDDGQRREDEVALILARPVFSPNRRPKEDAAPAQVAAPVTTLPRMTAILINGQLRSAIFAGDGKPTVLGEGGRLGPFTIQSIEPQQVIVVGPEGKRTVRTSFSNDPPPPQLPLGIPQGMPMPPATVVLPPGMPVPRPAR